MNNKSKELENILIEEVPWIPPIYKHLFIDI